VTELEASRFGCTSTEAPFDVGRKLPDQIENILLIILYSVDTRLNRRSDWGVGNFSMNSNGMPIVLNDQV
jgi:hypothetical protein